MKQLSATLVLLSMMLVGFVWHTSQTLPAVVGTHFAADGAVNGVIPRDIYVATMISLMIVLPLLVSTISLALTSNSTRINIPNRDYWLAPEHRERTLAFIRMHVLWFAAAVAVLLGYVHWLVVEANALQPPALSNSHTIAGVVTFIVALGAWLCVLFVRFRR